MLETLSQVQRRDLDLDVLLEERGQTPTELLSLRERITQLQSELEAGRNALHRASQDSLAERAGA